MNPITHFLIGWSVAAAPRDLTLRDRAMIAMAGVLPDIDGLGAPVELLTRDSPHPHLWWSEYHHLLAHNALFAASLGLAALLFARSRALTAALVLVSVHLHFLCDLFGSRGPDGFNWSIPYLAPFSRRGVWIWDGQWMLNAWQNEVVTIVALALVFFIAWSRGLSPLVFVSSRANDRFVAALRQRVPRRENQASATSSTDSRT